MNLMKKNFNIILFNYFFDLKNIFIQKIKELIFLKLINFV